MSLGISSIRLKIRQNNSNFKYLIFYSLNVVYFDCNTQGENKTSFQESWKLKRSKIWIFLIPTSVFQDFLIPEISLNKSMLLNAFIIRFKKTERNLIWKWFSLFRVTPETSVSRKNEIFKINKKTKMFLKSWRCFCLSFILIDFVVGDVTCIVSRIGTNIIFYLWIGML